MKFETDENTEIINNKVTMININNRRLFIFKIMNILIIFTSVITCIFFTLEAQKFISHDTFFITPIINDNKFYFNDDDINVIKATVKTDNLVYTYLSSGVVSYGSYNIYSRIVYTNSDYFLIHNTLLTHGGRWFNENDNVIVINESLAWQLFGSVNIVGNDIFVSGIPFTVVGVITQNRISKGDSVAYLPGIYQDPIYPSRDGLTFSSIILKASEYNRLSTGNDIIRVIESIGRNTRDYYITDINSYLYNMSLNYKLLIFIIGIYAGAIIIINTYKLITSNQPNKKNITILTVLLVLDILFIYLLILNITFDILIPYGDGSRLYEIIRMITNHGFLPYPEYLTKGLQIISRLNMYANISLIVGVVALFNFMFLHKVYIKCI